jgi:hypothetical protein
MRLMTLFSEAALSPAIAIEAVDHPEVERAIPDFLQSAETAFDSNPDYQAQQRKIRQEDIRVAVREEPAPAATRSSRELRTERLGRHAGRFAQRY